jgi:anti-sigma factor RsiW
MGMTAGTTMTLNCRDLIELIAAYSDDELDDATRAAFEHHLAHCRSCRAYLRSYLQTIELARTLPLSDCHCDAPEELVDAILRRRSAGAHA